MNNEETEFRTAIEQVLNSASRKKLVVAGPGTGKTTLFKQMLEFAKGEPGRRLVLTFINNLKNDLERDLSSYARVSTLHSYCLKLLYRDTALRAGLSSSFRCQPGLGSLIRADWLHIEKCEAPHFFREMRNLEQEGHIPFYLARGEYYDAVDFDDSVYRVTTCLAAGASTLETFDLVLVDEYQDFHRLEAVFIEFLAKSSAILILGDDDQALYSQLRNSSWDYIRSLHCGGEYEVFKLPFCIRCPEVIVDAVGDVIKQAKRLGKLMGRIDKPYRYFAPAKGADSKKYPRIALIETSVQRQKANYMGCYIAQAISGIPCGEIEEAATGGYPAALVIVAQPYREQIINHLEAAGYAVDKRQDSEEMRLDRKCGLAILKEHRESNLGWRIVLEGEQPSFVSDLIIRTGDRTQGLFDILPGNYRDRVLAEADAWKPSEKESDDVRLTKKPRKLPTVRVTSFEGAKGLSAQHVFIAGLHNGELPLDPSRIRNLEICKLVVGLTRTRKKCSLVYTRRFADQWKSPSSFISWIKPWRFEQITIDRAYWDEQAKGKG